jgi:hypothetical protein
MRLKPTRRGALLGGGLLGAAATAFAAATHGHARDALGLAPKSARVTEPGRIAPPTATPLQRFRIGDAAARRFGAFEFRSGLVLTSSYEGFGGFSGLAVTPDGARALFVTDAGDWVSARLERGQDGALLGLSEVETGPLMASDGRELGKIGRYDSEGLTLAPDGFAYVSFERVHEIWGFDARRQGLAAPGRKVETPAAMRRLGANKSLEAIAAAPDGGPLEGLLIVVGERPSAAFAPDANPAWAVARPGRAGGFAFALARADDYDVSDAAFLPDGDLLVLERRFKLLDGVRLRLRRVPASAIRPGARVESEVVLSADMGFEIDNMEGLAVHREADGTTVVTMVSDDNFNWFQRNLMLEFRYVV